ncbi:MAG TPA: tetratricopeptide repeat protein [Lacipirellulaceae bacterium]|nr:tetratricopeptide repeat protein [Lacipirellulaceae bacterium]
MESTQVSTMQEYRINYSLLIGLIIGTFVCSGAIYALHQYQNSRQSGWLISEAEKAVTDKDYRGAVQYYQQYLSIHPEDKDTWIKYGNTFLDLAGQDDVTPDELGAAIQALELMLRDPGLARLPETKKLRRRLATFYGRDNIRNYSSALDHLNLLLDADPNDVELQVRRATYLAKSGDLTTAVKESYKLIGYNPKADDFDLKKATAPHAVEVYFNLAGILRGQEKNDQLAERVVNQMIHVNPTDAEAYVDRGRLRAAWGDMNGARADAKKAYELKPNDSDVLLFNADIASQDKEIDKARQFVATAKKLHPKEARIYQRGAGLEMQDKKFDKAMAELDEGVKAVGGSAAMNLMFVKARLQIESGDLKGARQTVDDMQQVHKLLPVVADYFDALFLLAENKWYEAAESLNKLRPRISGFGEDMETELDYDLGLCYEHLGHYEQAQQKFEQIVERNPQNAPAAAGVERMKLRRGLEGSNSAADPTYTAMMEELKKPKPEQDVSKINKLIEDMSKNRKLDEMGDLLFKAQVAIMREDYDGAAQYLIQAGKRSPNDLRVNRLKIQLARLDPKIGPAKALEYLQKLIEQLGDQPSLRLDKADILVSLNKDKEDKQQLKQQLAELVTGIDKWTDQQKVELWRGMARCYINLNMMDEARQFLNLAADKEPNDLPLRLALFSMALDANDAEGMKTAQEKILQIVGDKGDCDYLYTEARRRLWQLRRGQLSRDSLGDIRSLVTRALDQRPESSELYALLAEIELVSNNPASALKNYDEAEKLGRPAPTAVAMHIRLLADNGRFDDAGKLLDRIPEVVRQSLLGPLYAEVLFRTNQVDEAIKQARAATEADPTSAANQYWYSQLLARSAQAKDIAKERHNQIMDQAIQAMRKATQLQPEFPDAWFALINYNLMQDKEPEANAALRDAQLVLSGDNLAIFLARSYEILHRWFDAETMYREFYETNPSDLQRAQQLAAFYMGPMYPRPDRQAKATPLINQILKAGADGKLPANDRNLLWARRTAATILAGTGDYQNLRKAENLLTSNSQDGSLLIEDKLALAQILAPRPEPLSRSKAIALLEDVSQVQQLNEAASIVLGELYYETGHEWVSQMEKTVSRFPNSIRARESYARKLLARGDQGSIDRAKTLVSEMQKLSPNYPASFELAVRVAGKLGKQKQVRDALLQRLPDFSKIKKLDASQEQTLATFAGLLVDLNDLDSAEKIYSELASRDPALVYNQAMFLGMHRSPEQCFAKLNEIYSADKVSKILDVALSVARERRDKIGDKFDADIQRWIDAGLRENPDSMTMLMKQADLFDLQKRYDDAETLYSKLLKRPDLKGPVRAVVLNNLAYILALAGKSTATDDPMKLIVEAAGILGPNSDILDTRAVVSMSRQQYKAAISDLELSVTDNPTASKYFHLAEAHLGAGEKREAVEAWEKAEGLGLNRDSLNRMEHDRYEQVKAEINKIRGPAVTKSDGLRKAG